MSKGGGKARGINGGGEGETKGRICDCGRCLEDGGAVYWGKVGEGGLRQELFYLLPVSVLRPHALNHQCDQCCVPGTSRGAAAPATVLVHKCRCRLDEGGGEVACGGLAGVLAPPCGEAQSAGSV